LPRLCACLLAGALLLSAAPARAQGADPREAAAKKACAAGRVDEGVELLAELFANTGDVNYVYNQGRCYQQNGVHDKAIQRFREYLRRSPDLPAAERQEVERFISEAEEQVRQRQVAAAKESEARSPVWRTASLALGGLGVVAVGTGVVLSLKVRSAEKAFERDLAALTEVDNRWIGDRNRDGARLETFQWVAYGVGAAALAGAVASYLVGGRSGREPPGAVSWAPAPGGFSTAVAVRY
jgi:tetratricopeptide (TPR) repeat protein